MARSPDDMAETGSCAVPLPPGLVHVSDRDPGISRRGRGRGFEYRLPDGSRLTDRDEIARIRTLAIPPAYRDVWICMLPNGHIQATGFDAARRKQYRYHAEWHAHRSDAKFERLAAFGRSLPRIRRKVAAILRDGADPDAMAAAVLPERDYVIAALVRLLDRASLRIGSNRESVTGAVGATTLARRSLRLDERSIRLDFVAKGGKRVRVALSDRTLHRVLGTIHALPGRRLFRYRDEAGEARPVDSGDVNAWLKEASGDPSLSAKAFRTWAGTLAAFERALDPGRVSIKTLCETAAERLRNTPAISRKSYIHPDVLALAEADEEARAAIAAAEVPAIAGLRASEARLVAFLERDT